MTRVIVVYESKYGNTKLAAETIMEGMNEIEKTETVLKEVRDVEPEETRGHDVILVGSPNHFGGPTRGVKKFIDKLGRLGLEGKLFAVFDTYIKGDFEKVVKKMEKRINEKVPGLKMISPGLSIKVQGMKGPILEGELPKCKELGNKIANQLKA